MPIHDNKGPDHARTTQVGGYVPTHPDTQTSNFHKVSDKYGIFLADMATLPPTVCPDLIPEGWDLLLVDGEPDVLELTIGGEPVEGYLMRRLEFHPHD